MSASTATRRESHRRPYENVAAPDQAPLYDLVPVKGPQGEPLDAYRGVRRRDTSEIVSVVGSRYQLVQPRGVAHEDAEEIAGLTRTFSWRDVTSGLPDDCREEDERQEERRIREMRARVKVARAVVATTSGLAETLASDWRKAVLFYPKFGVTKKTFRCGVPARESPSEDDLLYDSMDAPVDTRAESRSGGKVTLPG